MRAIVFLGPLVGILLFWCIPSPNLHIILRERYTRSVNLTIAHILIKDTTACILSTERTLHCVFDYTEYNYEKCADIFWAIHPPCLYPSNFKQIFYE